MAVATENPRSGNPAALVGRLRRLRRTARALLLLEAAAWLAMVLLAAVAILAGADYFFRFQDPGLRLMAWLALVAAAAWGARRFAWRAVAFPLDDLRMARWVERRFPELGDRLATAVEFHEGSADGPYAGSASMRRAVIASAAAQLETLDLPSTLNARPVVRVAVAAAALCLAASAVVFWQPVLSRTAVVRLVAPWSGVQWPKQNHLAFVEPIQRVAYGQSFEVELIDRLGAPLPADAWILYRYEGQTDAQAERQPMQHVGSRLVARREAVPRPFAYRAVGGDDDAMPWIELELVEPPLVEEVGVTLHFPAYTGWKPETSSRHIRALVGTQVLLTARASKPLAEAWVVLEGGRRIAAGLADDGRRINVPGPEGEPLVIETSGAYWFELVDREGLRGGEDTRFDVRAVSDSPPRVSIDAPEANVFVTPTAVVPLKIAVKDDLAIAAARLAYVRSDLAADQESSIPLFAGPPQVPASPGPEAPEGSVEGIFRSLVLEQTWDLSSLDLQPGMQLTLAAVAADYRPSEGRSQARRLEIISPDELEERIAQRQSFILGELGRLLRLEQESRSLTQSLEIQLEKVGRLAQADLDRLQGAELTQRQVDRGLVSAGEGVGAQIRQLLADLANNRVDSPEVTRRMQHAADEVARLERQHLPVISRELTAALKSAQTAAAAGDRQGEPGGGEQHGPAAIDAQVGARVAASLGAAGESQDAVIASLEGLTADLAEWDNYRRFYRDVGQLRREQEALAQETGELAKSTLAKELRDLTPQQTADLEKQAGRQLELARQLDKLVQQMHDLAGRLAADDPLAAETLGDAVAHGRETGTAGQMRAGARQLAANQVAQALETQRQAVAELEEMLDILANRRQQQLERLVKKLREAEEQLAQLRQQHEGLRKKLAEADSVGEAAERRRQLERLAREEEALAEQTGRFARRLARLQAERAAESSARAAAGMSQAAQQGEAGNAAEAGGHSGQAQRDLDEAQQHLAERRAEAEAELAREQLARLEDGLAGLCQRQQAIGEETLRIESERQAGGRLGRPEAVSLRQLAGAQHTLADETQDISKALSAAQAFQLALLHVRDEMRRSAGLLDHRRTDQETQLAQQAAVRRLQEMLEALQPDEGDPEEGQQGGSGEGGGAAGQGIPLVAQFKLLKLLQQDVNARTAELAARLGQKQRLSPAETEEYAALSRQQGLLADMMFNLLVPDESNPADDPLNLPEPMLEPTDPSQPAPGPPIDPAGSSEEPRADRPSGAEPPTDRQGPSAAAAPTEPSQRIQELTAR